MLTHGNLAANTATLVTAWGFSAQDRLLHALPVYHAHGLFVGLGCALTAGASFITPETLAWIKGHTALILFASFVASAVLLQLLLWFTRVNILKLIVLVGTFALAMAFAANDLVNFIGVPLAGLASYTEAAATSDPLGATMEAL